jgi:hypothetical protein
MLPATHDPAPEPPATRERVEGAAGRVTVRENRADRGTGTVIQPFG